jgi:general stress protein 26
MPWDCMSCKYQKHIKHQEEGIRYLELELKAATDEADSLKNRNMSNKMRDNDNTNDIWLKPKNSKSMARRFSANDIAHIRLSNKFSVLEADQQNHGLLKLKYMKIK